MEILKVLTKRNLKLNKKRTIVTIIGITLSTALIVCVAGMVTSFQKTLIHSAIQQYGNYHVQIRDMDRDDALALEENRDVKSYSFISSVGYSKLKNPQNEYKPYIFVTSFDEKALSSLGLHLLDGRLPENENEIVLSEHLLTKENLNVSIGDTLSLSIGKRYVSAGVIENEASQENAFEPEISESLKEEQVHNYKVVGIVERPNYSIEDYSAPGYTCITFKESYEEKQDAFLLYKDAKGYSKKTKNIASEKYGYQYNSELLRWLGVSESETMYALYAVAGIVITIIIVSSVFVIKNSFDISITEKFKMYGMFRSVGATSKQIKRNVLYEGFLLGCIAIPCGILCGIIAILILIFLINVILGDFLNGVKFVYSLPLLPIVLTIVLASVTICFSTFFAAKRAGKIFPIEAIRSNNDVKIKRKELHTPKWVKGLFNTGGVIAYKNLKRNKKKYRTTVVSLVVSIFVFISLFSFIEYGFKMSNLYYTNMGFNMILRFEYETPLGKQDQEKVYKEIATFEDVDTFSIYKHASFDVDEKKYLSSFGKKVLEDEMYGDLDLQLSVISLGEEEYVRYLKKLHLRNDDVKKGILIDDYLYYDKKGQLGNIYTIQDHEKLSATTSLNKELTLEIIRADERPMGLEGSYNASGYLIVSDAIMNEYFDYYLSNMFIDSKNANKLEEKIEKMQDEDQNYKHVYVNNFDEDLKANNAIVLTVSIFLYGFITVISLIGITNIFNTITTNMNLRSKEFAMLKSVGMTKKEFNRMIRLESIFYGCKALFIGIPLGLGGSYLLYKTFQGGLEFSYQIPVKALVIVFVFVSLIIGIIMRYSLHRINKQNIIETIRNDNI